MSEFTEKKLGEVLAFCLVGQETVRKAGSNFSQVIGEEKVKRYSSRLADIAASIGTEATELTRAKSEKTAAKLRSLRGAYIGDEWDNPTEVLEWLGFFEGAAIVHWFLILGSAETTDNLKLGALAHSAIDLHRKSLANVEDHLHQIGGQRADKKAS